MEQMDWTESEGSSSEEQKDWNLWIMIHHKYGTYDKQNRNMDGTYDTSYIYNNHLTLTSIILSILQLKKMRISNLKKELHLNPHTLGQILLMNMIKKKSQKKKHTAHVEHIVQSLHTIPIPRSKPMEMYNLVFTFVAYYLLTIINPLYNNTEE